MTLQQAIERNKVLTDALEKLRLYHRETNFEDVYACPKAQAYYGREAVGSCDCGADEHNAIIDAALQEPTQEELKAEPLPQVGEMWWTRNGKTTSSLKRSNNPTYPIQAKVEGVCHTWTKKGEFLEGQVSGLDLISKV